LPEAMFNFLALLGWSYSPDTDLFSREQAIAAFDLRDINVSAGALPIGKLDWMNGIYIRALDVPDLSERLLPFLSEDLEIPIDALRSHPALPVLVPLIQERIKTLADASELVDFAFLPEIEYEPEMLVAKGLDAAGSLSALRAAHSLLIGLPFSAEALEPPLRQLADDLHLKAGQLFGILRVAVTGKNVAPPLFGSLVAVGRVRTLARIERAEELLLNLARGS
jgi:glutamyl-tRNA synthetase